MWDYASKLRSEELKRVLREYSAIGYNTGCFRNDLANSDPVELCMRYTLKLPTDGYARLSRESRLDLAAKDVVWKFKHEFHRQS